MTTRQHLGARAGALPNPLAAARALTSPSTPHRIEDPVISRMQRIRTALGVASMSWLLLAYPLRDGRQDFVLGKLEELLIGCAIILAAAVIGVGLCVLSAPSPLRRAYARRVVGPLKALSTLPLGAGVVWLMAAALGGDLVSLSDVGPHDITFGFFGSVLGTIFTGLLIGLLFAAAALVCAAVLVAAV
ncbi:hypothetical protein, partial [Streptomyces sp. NPDC003034]